jgi:hypothetical protein
MIVNVDGEIAKAYSGMGWSAWESRCWWLPSSRSSCLQGFIYRAFERQWGWFIAMIATSVLFGLYHPYAWSAFASSIVLCVHHAANWLDARANPRAHALQPLLWWPLLGHTSFPTAPR